MTAPPSRDRPTTTIGWREYVSVADWGITGIVAKADTGARSSAIDVANLEELPGGLVRFDAIVSRESPGRYVSVETEIVRRTKIRSSFGKATSRLVVSAVVRIGEVEKRIELGLVCRKNMRCRMLLGRTALRGVFQVDPGRCYLLGRKRRKKKVAPS